MSKKNLIKKLTKKGLVDIVLGQIKNDIRSGDVTSIEEMLQNTPSNILIEYLPEDLDNTKIKELLDMSNQAA